MSDELPLGWATAKLNDVVSFVLGGDWGKDPDSSEAGLTRVRVIRGTEFKNWRKEKGASAAERRIKISSLEKRRLQKGDLVLEVSGGGPNQPVGRTVLIDDDTLKQADAPLVCSNFFRLLRLSSEIDSSFLSHILSRAYGRAEFNKFQTETTNLRNLNVTDFLEDTDIPLAPLTEQRRIVAKLEQVLGKVESCQRRLAKIPALLKRFRQSVLAAACSGRLTADWREENPSRTGSPRANKEETKSTAEIPLTWALTTLDALCQANRSISYGIVKPGVYDSKGVRLLKSQQVRDGTMDLTEDFRITRKLDEEYARTRLVGGEILLNLVGASIGRSAIAPVELRGANVSRAIAVIPVSSEMAAWVQLNLRGPVGQKLIQEKTGGSAQPVLNLSEVRTLTIPLPPLPEQQEIVRRVEALFALADKIEARYAKAQAQVDRLTPSLLDRAFAGKLVPQDPADEPAAVLLERIRRNGPAASTGPIRATVYPEPAPRELKVAEPRANARRR